MLSSCPFVKFAVFLATLLIALRLCNLIVTKSHTKPCVDVTKTTDHCTVLYSIT